MSYQALAVTVALLTPVRSSVRVSVVLRSSALPRPPGVGARVGRDVVGRERLVGHVDDERLLLAVGLEGGGAQREVAALALGDTTA